MVLVSTSFAAPVEYTSWQSVPPTQSIYHETEASWTTLFDDPILNELLAIAISQSPDLASAEERLNYAKATARSVGSSRFPLIQAGVLTQDQNIGTSFYNYPNTQYGLTASYELDIFGKNWNESASEKFNYKAEKERYQLAKVLLTHELVAVYAGLRAAEKTVELTEKNLQSLEETQSLVSLQQTIGESNLLDVERANSLVQHIKSQLAMTRHRAQNSQLILAALVGKTLPQLNDILSQPQDIPHSETFPLLDEPVTTILNRPDVKAAENQLKSAKKDRLAAIGNWLPDISLSGFYGRTNQLDSDYEDVWTTQVDMTFDLVDFGKLESDVKASTAQQQQALATYKKTILVAISEVESSISEYNARTEALTALKLAEKSATEALSLSKSLYNLGEINFLDLLDAERTLINADLAEVEAELNQTLALSRLYKSVGLD